MRVRLALSASFVGIVLAFWVWAVHWALADRRELTYGMPGQVASLDLAEGPQVVSAADERAATEELRTFLVRRDLSLVIASVGDGRPQMTVFDTSRRLPWASPVRQGGDAGHRVYLVRGSYSAARWSAAGSAPLLPPGARVAGVVPAPPGAADVQYVQPLPETGLPTGAYVVDTTDRGELGRMERVLARQGLVVHGSHRTPLWYDLWHDSLVAATSLFVGLGLVCAAAYWWLLLGGRTRELLIRRRHGARLLDVVRQWLVQGLPGLASGVVAGVVLSGVVVRLVGRAPLTAQEDLVLLLAGAGGVVVMTMLWVVTLAVWSRGHDAVRRAA